MGVIMTKDGRGVAKATGHGEGKVVESGRMRYVTALFYQTYSENKLAFLNHLMGVNEYEVDASGIMNTGYGNGNKRSQIVIYFKIILRYWVLID
jgi:hypothetical protein